MSRVAHLSRPEVQARMIANAADPEYARRQTFVKAAKGNRRRDIAVPWFIAWQTEGRRSPDFPELAAWEATKRATGWRPQFEIDREWQRIYERWWPERETISFEDWKVRENVDWVSGRGLAKPAATKE